MHKIMIVGPVGSGKTTFSKQLSTEKKISSYQLDNLIWDRRPSGDQPYPVEESMRQLEEILMQKSWIIEGTTTRDWIKPAIEAADIIFLLLPPYHIRVYRILSRFIKQITKKETANYKPTIHILKMMFRWNHHFEIKNMVELQKLTECSNKKLIIIDSNNAYLSSKKYC